MFKYAFLLLSLASHLAHADLIKPDDKDYWTVDGLAHYVRSREDDNYYVRFVSNHNNPSVVAFAGRGRFCIDEGQTTKMKVQYQWVNFIQRCSSGRAYWIPKSQQGINFVKKEFSGNSDVQIMFNNVVYSFSTKKYTSVRQHWERTLKTLGKAL
ncbi:MULTISPECIES: hypothetical protein [Vibrio]|uniref:hypothetical protein n=1 Tax=Vibrio TaxID=662 RepID=UPI0020756AF0|nr:MULTISPECIES: hypothetical protein [Vibrio]USD35358.1 hypothetical protein J8Z27_18945 [Vibrio sp. SCSIO 43186]USD48425.1 hypothetical protein J4N38_19345 [Vibrio sp. SCSIO 43145]USD72483.1 hypothetical protein J4N41_18955 [Vibrio sp. SCSIO 43139]USD98159.1 hypothetical protein CTT30_19150 [Vibrio coralliilyticus]